MASRDKSRNVGWSTAQRICYHGTRRMAPGPTGSEQSGEAAHGVLQRLAIGRHRCSAVLGYVNHRKAQGRANATVNADLAVLRKTLRVAQELGKAEYRASITDVTACIPTGRIP